MTRLKLTRVGNSVGALLPREALARLHVGVGDSLFLTESPEGYRITPYDPRIAEEMSLAETIMKRRRTVLRQLGK